VDALSVSVTHRLRAFALDVALGVGDETFALVGPSGAGKSSLLRAIAGLLRPDHGHIAVDDRVWLDTDRGVDLPVERRSVGFVFQEYALFPHLDVERNIGYGGRANAHRLLESFGLTALARERPTRLSGGERQRVALARALARDPDVLLLDEPLGALDAQTRAHVRAELRSHLRTTGLPTLLVTHDYEDAAALADRVGVLVGGELVQVGTPGELVAAPATSFVAAFTGANVLIGTARPRAGLTEVLLDGGETVVVAEEGSGRVAVVVHPWEVSLARTTPSDSMQNHIRGRVESVTALGNRLRVRIGPITAEVTQRAGEELAVADGETLVASFKATGASLVPLG
jgi:molybdate transport system ATP-binding protein